MEAWYKHTFEISENNVLGLTFGIIDATEYLDENAYSNDEYTQFMNEALVNSPQVFLPSYDLGVALRWDACAWSLRAVYMNVGKDREDQEEQEEEEKQEAKAQLTDRDLGKDYDYLGAEIGYTVRTPLGEGAYRVVVSRTSRDFVDAKGVRAERRSALALSFDQELGKGVGAFFRLDAQAYDAALNYDSHYAWGIDLRGSLWGRESDNIGLGFALLNGGNQALESTRVGEAYYRCVLHEQFALSADIQYMKDNKTSGRDPRGFLLSLRADVHF